MKLNSAALGLTILLTLISCADYRDPDHLPNNARTMPVSIDGINFGDDLSVDSLDQKCNDPRFGGFGMSDLQFTAHILHDASDCLTLYNAGLIKPL